MFEVNKNKKHYIYDLYTNRYVCVVDSFEGLLKEVAKSFFGFLYAERQESPFFESLNMGNDTIMYPEGRFARRYMIFDENYKIIDIRNYKSEIEIYAENSKDLFKKKKSVRDYARYRIDPVPYLGKHWGKCAGLRHPHTTNEKRQNADVEYKDYVRAKRKPRNLPDAYDDIWRHSSKSWKNQSKKQKQWM